MSEYSYNELMKMQNEAIRRVEDMQRKARQSAGLGDAEKQNDKEKSPPERAGGQGVSRDEPKRVPMPNDYLDKLKSYAADSSRAQSEPDEKKEEPEKQHIHKGNTASNFSEGFKNILGDINIDSDKALLLSLILLLSEEGADETLIMALLYILT